MTRAHEQTGLGKPAHRATQVRTVNGKNLELFALDAADPAGDLAGLSIPRCGGGTRTRQPKRETASDFNKAVGQGNLESPQA